MECNTEKGAIIDLGSLYAELSQLSDNRDVRGVRYKLVQKSGR